MSTPTRIPDVSEFRMSRQVELRFVDVDAMGHVNNAVYWIPLEERFARDGVTPATPCRGEAEYRQAIEAGDRVHVLADDGADSSAHWFVDDEARVKASVMWRRLPPDLYG